MNISSWGDSSLGPEIMSFFQEQRLFTLPDNTQIIHKPPRIVFEIDETLSQKIKHWDGNVLRTFNKTGYARNYIDFLTEKYILLNSNRPLYMLDIGCGVGANSIFAYKNGYDVYCTDADKRHLDCVKLVNFFLNNEKNDNFSQKFHYDVLTLPDIGDYNLIFDIVTCSQVLHYLKYEDILLSLKSIKSLLKPSGIAIVSFSSIWSAEYRDHITNFFHDYKNRKDDAGLIEDIHKPGKLNHNPGYIFCADHNNFPLIAQKAGLYVESCIYQNLSSSTYTYNTDYCSHVVFALSLK